MPPATSPDYLAAYPAALVAPIREAIAQGRLAAHLLWKYPAPHDIRTDKALYDYVEHLRSRHLRNTGSLSKVTYDSTLRELHKALGTHTQIARIQGNKLKAKREIRVASLFRDMPVAFLHMIVVHELAHLKEREHDKAFYQLCRHMAPDYFQLEFDLRAYLAYREAGGEALWAPSTVDRENSRNSHR